MHNYDARLLKVRKPSMETDLTSIDMSYLYLLIYCMSYFLSRAYDNVHMHKIMTLAID